MLSKIDQVFDFNAQALKLRAFRQQLIASNIANADTPNYKAVDIDFASELKRVTSKQAGNVRLATTQSGHMGADSGNTLGAKVQYRTINQPNIDGNTVNMDSERAQFSDNTLRYEAGIRFLNGQIKGLLTAIRGQ